MMNTSERRGGGLTVKDLMSPNVLAARADWSLQRLCEFFADNEFSGAPVTDEKGKLIGVVSVTDIIRYDSQHVYDIRADRPHDFYVTGLEDRYAREEIAALRIEQEDPVLVRDIMTPMIFEVDEETAIPDAAETMIKGHIHRVFVTRGREVVGVLTALDMLKALRDR